MRDHQSGSAESAENPLDMAAVWAADVRTEPYLHLVIEDLLAPGMGKRLIETFPTISVTGFVTLDEADQSPLFQRLLAALKRADLTEVLSNKFGQDMHPYPRLVTVRRWSREGEGKIHTDSERKVMTLLLYLNEQWSEDAGGQFRVLHGGEAFEPYALEVPPLTGRTVAFVRSDHSWHGHLPFTGERKVVQVTWLRDEKALSRKQGSNRLHQGLKRLFGRRRLPDRKAVGAEG